MKKKTTYKDAPKGVNLALEKGIIVEDFLPSPKDLVLMSRDVKVTINLTEQSVGYFKKASAKYGIPYQKLIKRVLDTYASRGQALQ